MKDLINTTQKVLEEASLASKMYKDALNNLKTMESLAKDVSKVFNNSKYDNIMQRSSDNKIKNQFLDLITAVVDKKNELEKTANDLKLAP